MATRRQNRVNHLLQQEISEIIRVELSDPDIGFTTITGVEVSPDLRRAHVYTSIMGDETEVRKTMAALVRARGLLRSQLGARVHLKYIPELIFELDETAREAQRIEALIGQFQREESEQDIATGERGQGSAGGNYGATIARIAELLKAGQPTVILIHRDPDGDAVGSGLALSLALEQLGQSVPVLCSDPVPARYHFLPETNRITGTVPQDFAVAVILDAGDYSQLGELADVLGRAGRVVWIDHHRTNQGGGDIDYLDVGAAATALQVYRVIEALGARIDQPIATCLYCGLATDTGFFTFENTSAEALAVASELVRAGADSHWIAAQAQGRVGLAAARLRGRALASVATAANGRIVHAALTPGDFAAAGASQEDTNTIIDLLKLIAGGEVQVLFKAVSHNHWRVSLRSGTKDVAAIAQQFGGGGHVPAAGCTITGSLPEVRARVLRAITRALDGR